MTLDIVPLDSVDIAILNIYISPIVWYYTIKWVNLKKYKKNLKK